jgi:cytoplasmic FMR1 interacting protein
MRFNHIFCLFLKKVVQGDLLPILHRLDKRKKPELPSLLQIRALAADWIKGVEPADGSDYKQYSRQHGSVTAVHPVRVVSASVAQLLLLREHIRNLYHEKSSLRSKAGMFTKADLEKEDEKNFEEFFRETWSFPHVLDFTQSLAEASNLGALWFREFHLEITKCVQFPIEMSLPWIIAEHAIVSHSGDVPLMENVLFVMDIYNDAASTALHRLQQQHLYDEIEAETNLVLDQLIFLISDEAYSHFKNFSASKLLDKAFKNKLESLKGQAGTLFVGFQRYQSLITQKNVSILGRSIDLSYPVAHQVVEKLYRDVDVAIKRFEASDPCAVVELVTLLDVLRGTHAEASQYLEIESFDSIFHDVNETHLDPAETEAEAEEGADTGMGSGAVRGRVTSHMMRGLCRDLVPNFSYNAYTSRFVRSPLQLQPIEYQRAPKYSAIATAYGSICHKAYEAQDRLTNRFFGRKHIEAYMSLVGRGYADFEVIAEECMSDIQGLLTDIDAYTNVLIDGIPPCKPPKYMFRAGGCYGYYEGKLKSLLEFEELKPGVFQVQCTILGSFVYTCVCLYFPSFFVLLILIF